MSVYDYATIYLSDPTIKCPACGAPAVRMEIYDYLGEHPADYCIEYACKRVDHVHPCFYEFEIENPGDCLGYLQNRSQIAEVAVEMLCNNLGPTVTPEHMLATAKAKLSGHPQVRYGREVYDAEINPQGAVMIINVGGFGLGLKPGEFEWVEDY